MSIRREKETETTTTIITRKDTSGFIARARRVRRTYEVNTRKTIEKAIRNLEVMAEYAHERATSKYLPTEVRQKWARIEAYIYQIINSLTRTYDSQMVMEKLEELTHRVKELEEEDQEPGKED